MKVYVTRRARFSAAHSYENIPLHAGIGGISPTRSVHGHNYAVEVTCSGHVDPSTGMVVNITDIDHALKAIIGPLDQTFLEKQHPEAAWGIPTTENLALWFWQEGKSRIPVAELHRVRVEETDDLWSDYNGSEDNMVYLTRAYEFSAAHRLHSPNLSDEENAEVFGKCNNPNGHGHNYGLEVTVRGVVDRRIGTAYDLGRLDDVVRNTVLNRLDHKNLNLDVPDFASLNPTSENLAVVIWRMLSPQLGCALHKVCVRETGRNYFEYYGEE